MTPFGQSGIINVEDIDIKGLNNKKDKLSKLRQGRIVELEKRVSTDEKISELNARLAAIVEYSDDAIIGKDLNGLVTSWNRGAERIYGYSAEEMMGRHISVLSPSGKPNEIPTILERIARGEVIEHYETVRTGKDGREIHVSLTISPIKDNKGKVVGVSTIARDITRRKHTAEALRKSEERLSLALEASNDGVWDWHVDGETYLSPKYYEMTGYAPGEVRPDLDFYKSLIHPDDLQAVMRTMQDHMEGRTEQSIVEYRMITKSGVCKYILGRGKVIERDRNGRPVRMIGTISDITESKRAEEQVRLAKEEWEQTFDAMPDIVAVIDNRHVIRRANAALAAKLHISRDSLIGRSCHKVICGLEEPLTGCPGSAAISIGEGQMEERFLENLNGHYLISCTPISSRDGSISSFVEVCRDISERKKAEEKLREAAITDPLTGLFNRRGFLALAQQQLNVAERNKRNMMLLYLDLDKMKEINDKFGHKEGDQALVDTAALLKKTFRASDIVGRMGGDEFAVLLTEPSERNVKNIVFDHIERNLKGHNEEARRPYRLSFSIGIAYYDPARPCSFDDLLIKADRMMYEEKKRHEK